MNIREVTIEDYEILLSWRNDIETRRNSHNMDLVDENKHIEWLKKVIEDRNRQLYICEIDGYPVGTCRIDLDDNGIYELSWTIAPNYRGKGIGKKMVSMIVDNFEYKNIRAEVKKENIASKKICEYLNMYIDKEEDGVIHYKKNYQ